MRLIKGSILNAIEALATARQQLDALPQNTIVVITKTVNETANPVYTVYATLGGLEAGQIRES